jgi:hypothetical protein
LRISKGFGTPKAGGAGWFAASHWGIFKQNEITIGIQLDRNSKQKEMLFSKHYHAC